MLESKRMESSSSWWLPVYFLACIPLAWLWTSKAYRASHLENQGIDIVNHAILIHETQHPDGPTSRILLEIADYPLTAHRIAARAMPWFGDDPILAMRCVALIAILWTYGIQLAWLRRFLRWPQALAGLIGIQLVCVYCKVASVNCIMWEGQYNWSRLVATVGFWGCLYLLSLAPSDGRLRFLAWILALAAASFSFICHLAAGFPALVAVGAFGFALAVEKRRWSYLLLSGASLVTFGVLFVLSGVWQNMANLAPTNGWLPVRFPPLLAIWVLVAGAVVVRWVLRTRQQPDEDETLGFERSAGAGLIAAGLFQAYLAYGMFRGGVGAYAVKTQFFLTVPLALFLLCYWGAEWAARTTWQPRILLARRQLAFWSLALVLLGYHVARLLRHDPGRVASIWKMSPNGPRRIPPVDLLPHVKAQQLRLASLPSDVLYLDPWQPTGSYYLNATQFRHDRRIYVAALEHVGKGECDRLFELEGIREVWLPRDADPTECWTSGIACHVEGDYWICRKRQPHSVPGRTVSHRSAPDSSALPRK